MNRRQGTRNRRLLPPGAGAPSTFLPTQLAGCVLWLRADLGITIGTGVSAWADQSGNAHNVTQATGSKQPSYNASDAGYNAQPTLSFASASSQWLSSSAWSASVASPYTEIIIGNDDGTATEQLYCDMQQGAANESVLYNTGGGAYGALNGAGSITAGTPSNAKRLLACVNNGASSGLYVSAKTPTSGTLGSNALTGTTVGGSISNSLFLNGKVAEFIVYSRALSASEIASVFTYLGARYAITIGS